MKVIPSWVDMAKFHKDGQHYLVLTGNYFFGSARAKKVQNALQDENQIEIRVKMTIFSLIMYLKEPYSPLHAQVLLHGPGLPHLQPQNIYLKAKMQVKYQKLWRWGWRFKKKKRQEAKEEMVTGKT